MKVFFAAAIIAGATFVSLGPSSAMTVAPQDNPSLVQTVRDACNAPQRNARCKWYGMPGVHNGPRWLNQTQHGKYHHPHKHYKYTKHYTHHS